MTTKPDKINSKNIDAIPGNTPLRDIPSDYYHKGSGFWFTLPDGIDAGKKLFFSDSIHGTNDPEKTVVFVHGNPETSYTYRKIIQKIINSSSKPLRIVAMDHIGFGLSDQASFEMVSMDHAENLLQLVRHLDLHNVILVIHDWGGPIGIGAFLKEPERVESLVILNSTVFPIPDDDITYKNYPIPWLGWSITPLIIPCSFWGGFAAYAVFRTPAAPMEILLRLVIFLILSKLGILPEDEKSARKIYKDQFNSKKNVRSSKRMVRQSAVWGHGNKYREPVLGKRDTAPFYHFIQENIGKLWGERGQNIDTRAVLGRWDPLAKKSVIKQWTNALPQLKGNVRIFEDTGHFIEEIRPDEIADAILTMT
ncbi:MAG: alpha/beta fold hydrolase [Desulfobacteraceae bacterium]|nr:alpha/beta fold hydrolase [Desulfobacteraceae bacterium]MBC2757453.1 alpha/beta fold hydrolase [Desulfobacteraceae bacterium]